ncbi:hypothetical protein ACEWY4_007631 [Coilia grayii]|uniref:Uncharacterized protein n=1 Tax=Coilia grayii TaxID=363190 RepID=A0ABD1KH20_9TELE
MEFGIQKLRHHDWKGIPSPLKPWVVVRNDGVVLGAHCNCTAGLGESCSHVSAVLFFIWEKNDSRHQEISCTSKKCEWTSPSEDALKNVEYKQGKDIIFNSTQQNKKRNSTKGVSAPPSFPRLTAAEQAQLYYNLSQCRTQDGKLVKPALLSVVNGYATSYVPKSVLLDLPEPLTKLYEKKARDLNLADLQDQAEAIFEDITVTEEQSDIVEEETLAQSKSRIWFDQRSGRVTGSTFRAATRTDIRKPAVSLIRQICYPKSHVFSSEATRWGCKNEDLARQYYEMQHRLSHTDVLMQTPETKLRRNVDSCMALSQFIVQRAQKKIEGKEEEDELWPDVGSILDSMDACMERPVAPKKDSFSSLSTYLRTPPESLDYEWTTVVLAGKYLMAPSAFGDMLKKRTCAPPRMAGESKPDAQAVKSRGASPCLCEKIASLRDALESWGLQECHLVCVTTDNATNNISAMELNESERLQCFGHRLQLAVGLTPASTKQAVERAVGVCKKVLMIARFLEQEKAVSQVLLADKKARHLVPSWQDMALLESLNKALAPLFEFTDALSGEKYVSVSFLKPVLHLFNNDILSRKDGDTELTQAVKEGVLKYLNEKYYDPTTDNLLDMATLADPRFKTAYMKEERVGFIKMRAVAELVGMVGGSTAPESAQRAAASSSPPAAEDDPELTHPTKKKKNLGSYFKKAVQPSTHSLPSRASIELELSMYLQAPVPDSETDPLEWWKQHELNFPIVARLAKKYLCIPATSSSSERAFSASGNIITCKRSCLKPNTVDQLVFLALNL